MTRRDRIEAKLSEIFNHKRLQVEDTSASHHGHGGYDPTGSHFHVSIAAEELNGLNRVGQHRAIYDALGPDLMSEIHALTIDIQN